MLTLKLICLLVAIACASALAIVPNRLKNHQISVEVEQAKWKNLFDSKLESRVENSERNEEKLKIQMTLVENVATNSWYEDNRNENADNDFYFNDETPVDFSESKAQSEEFQPIDEGAYDEVNARSLFDKFKVEYKRQYASAEEHGHRYNAFKQNLLDIKELNNNPSGTATYGITEFSDLTSAEFQQRSGFVNFADDELPPVNVTINIEIPEAFDWRDKHIITPVKQQGQCGSCWAFTTVGAIEAMYAKKTQKLEDFSEQQLVDCDTQNGGCRGGDPVYAYQALKRMGGLVSERDYPYRGQRLQCRFNRRSVRVAVSGGQRLPRDEQTIAKYLVEHGPVAVGINSVAMQNYRGGIAAPSNRECARDRIDHYVLAVGYGVAKDRNGRSLPYWILKNSWGAQFGGNERGYYRIHRGSNSCGVALYTSIVSLQ